MYPHLTRSRFAAAAFAAWTPRRVWALRGLTGGPSVFTTLEDRFGGSTIGRGPLDAPFETKRAWAFCSHGADAIEPLTSLSPLRSCRPRGRAFARASDVEGAAKITVFRCLVKDDGSYDLGCLPSEGALRRIQWPLQPRSRDHITALATMRPLDDALTPPWAFAGSAPFLYGPARLATRLRATRPSTCHRRGSLRARPPFTRTGPLLGGLMRERIWDRRRLPTSATALRRAGTSPSSRVLAGTEAATSFLF